MKDYKVIVVNGYENRQEKYKSDPRYELHKAIWWENVSEKDLEEYHFYHNCNYDRRKKIFACSESHKNVLKKIINEDLRDIIIIEDDAIIDFDSLHLLDEINEFCYVGGDINSVLVKDFKKFDKKKIRDTLHVGINIINPKIYRVGWACGYYIPNKEVASLILEKIPNGKKHRVIDVEYVKLQQKGIISKFLYPSIVRLNMVEALQGFNGNDYGSHYKEGDGNLY